eukprot:5695010-Pleurochrysis_carterae.AAC.1
MPAASERQAEREAEQEAEPEPEREPERGAERGAEHARKPRRLGPACQHLTAVGSTSPASALR